MDSAARQSDGIAQKPVTALLIVDLDKHIGNARAWRDTFGEQLPDLEIRIWPDAGNLAGIEYLAFMPIQDPKSLATMQQLAIDLSAYASSQSLYWAYWYFRYLTTPVQLMIIEAVSLGNTSDLDGSAFMRQYQTNVAILSLLDPSNRVAQEYVKAVQLFQLGNVLPTLVDFSGTETDDVVFDIQLILGGMTDNYRGSSNQDIRYAADAAGALTQD